MAARKQPAASDSRAAIWEGMARLAETQRAIEAVMIEAGWGHALDDAKRRVANQVAAATRKARHDA